MKAIFIGRAMKKFVKVVLIILGIAALGVAAIFYFTADMVTVADDFFKAVKSKDITKAYSYLSDDFKAGTTKEALSDFLSKYGLTEFKSASWQERSISGGRGELKGSITTESGGVVPITLSFVKGESGWKIYYIEKPASGIRDESKSVQIPSEEEQVKLVSATMHVFAVSVNDKSMEKFYNHCSKLWQKQITVQELDETFVGFFKVGVDLSPLDNLSPIFSEKATINEDGVLIIKGYYPTRPSQVYFKQSYITEGQSWKLFGLNVNIQ